MTCCRVVLHSWISHSTFSTLGFLFLHFDKIGLFDLMMLCDVKIRLFDLMMLCDVYPFGFS